MGLFPSVLCQKTGHAYQHCKSMCNFVTELNVTTVRWCHHQWHRHTTNVSLLGEETVVK